MHIPLVSVVMPLYNMEKYLRYSLDSIVNQTLKNIEIICVNDSSTDKTLDILTKYKEKDSRIKIITRPNGGCGAARNTGLEIANGEFIIFLDGDDVFELNMLEDLYLKATLDFSDIVICGYNRYDDKISAVEKTVLIPNIFVENSPFNPQNLNIILFDTGVPATWNKLIKRDLFVKHNLKFEEVRACTDLTCINLAMVLANRISILNKPYIYYRINQKNSLTSIRSTYAEGFLLSAKRLEEKLKELNLYEMFKDTFIKRMVATYKWELSICNIDQKREHDKMAKEIVSKELYSYLSKANRYPAVSVIIPVYNTEKYLKKCLDSIRQQTLENIEIICVDDGSTDNSLKILNEYKDKDARITVLQQYNQHAGVARNKGLSIATGEYLSFLDSDDFFDPHMLEIMYNTAKMDDADTVICGFKIYDTVLKKVTGSSPINARFVNASPFSPDYVKDCFFGFCRPNAWTKLFKRQLFIDNDIKFDDCICCNDFTGVCIALLSSKIISAVSEKFIYYRVNQNKNLTKLRKENFNGFISDLCAFESFKNNLIRLDLYRNFYQTFVNRFTKSFKDTFSKKHIELAEKYLSPELYMLFMNIDRNV